MNADKILVFNPRLSAFISGLNSFTASNGRGSLLAQNRDREGAGCAHIYDALFKRLRRVRDTEV